MLLQLEIMIWIVSLIILVVIPFVRLGQYMMRRYRLRQEQTIHHEEEVAADQSDEIVDEEGEEEVVVDPVIAAMLKDDDSHVHQESLDQDQESSGESLDGLEQSIDDEVSQNTASVLDEEVIQETTKMEVIDVTVTDPSTQESVEVIAADVDGDGSIDEAVIIHTSGVDIADAKRQKSIEMFSYELRSLKDKGQTTTYEKKLIEARALHPDHQEFSIMLAEHFYAQGEYRKSLGLYRSMLDTDSKDDKSLWMIANCYIKVGERDNAQVILEKLTADKSENPRYWMSLTEVYYHSSDLGKAIECVRTMVKLRPTNSDYLSTLAQLYFESEQFDLYVQVLYRMLELDPLNHEIKAEIAKYS